MKKQILQKTREQRVKSYIQQIKFLADPKHHKNLRVSVAAYGSWAARGKAGGCYICNADHHNYTFQHKRRTTTSGNIPREYFWNPFGDMCSECFDEVEKQCNYKFIKF